MSNRILSKQVVLRFLAATFGIGLLTYLVRRVGFGNLVDEVAALGWGLGLVVALGGLTHLAKAWAWRLTLVGEEHKVSFSHLLRLRLASEAAGQAGALGQLFGEGLRVSALGSEIPTASRISSVTLDRGLFIATGALVSLVGILAAFLDLSLSDTLESYAIFFAVTLIILLVVLCLAVRNRWAVLSRSAQAAGKLPWLSRYVESKQRLIESVESKLLEFHHETPRAFWASFGLNLLCHGLAVLEVYLVLWLMGAKIGFLGALIFEALTKLINVVGMFNPGNIGTYEAGNMLIARMFGLGGDSGLVLGIARRLRALFWAAIGGICLITLSRGKKSGDFANAARTPVEALKKQLLLLRSKTTRQSEHSSPIALVLTNRQPDGGFDSLLTRVGGLPVVLRAILGLQKAGCERIIVGCDPGEERRIKRTLMGTGRLPQSVKWFETPSNGRTLPMLLEEVTAEAGDEHVLVVDGNTAYHPALLRELVAWNRENDALVLTSGNSLVGICALSSDVARAVAAQVDVPIDTIEQLNSFLVSEHSVQHRPVPEECWQPILTPEDRTCAERKLDQWLVKPTDGIFARMNRRISVPISRQLIKWPVTPNMVSLFTLGVGFASGLFFARGGYWNVLLGAMLSVWASILDGCDGEVARLKLLESDFGCWLETICDYLYYLFVFSGMAIGLVRSSGPAYLGWTGLLLFGAITSFLVTGAGRRRFAGEHPEQYLKIWQRHAESRSGNPILYLGRHLEFIVRRCFFPYALLFFAAVNLTKVAFILTAIGVNVVWLISLYSYRSFVVPSSRSANSSAVSV